MSNARFSIVQARAVSDERLSDAQFRTLTALGCYGDRQGKCYPSLRTLGKKLHKSFQAVGRDVKRLVELGYLEKENRFDENGGKKSNLYHIKYDTLSTSEVDTLSTPEVDTLSTPEVDTLSTPEVDTHSTSRVDTHSPSEVDTHSTSEVDITSHVNDPYNDPNNDPFYGPVNVKYASRPNFQTMTVKEAYQVPALRIYREATNYFPGSAAWEFVHDTITNHGLTAERIRPYFAEWVARGYKPENIKGILDVVVNGWKEKERARYDPADSVKAREHHDREAVARIVEGMSKNGIFTN